ncbi:MAG: 2-C-methyl-D-erythritol 2,4-cyclodiphosphate synthase [Pyrinomonadaceae bacterium]|nr:2-C-methyl-D-erythritol 2,4-cyclodiphosphate synthase [Pyrinomonadaceae bacterium]MBP6212444.1 2-C-methyl-D-erythritol 2,4-cyclodiphosphate synthase [Pyrinomonadaceae bacterium]
MSNFRIGFGTDIHRLTAGRPLIVGGITIGSDLGADGHSDADVLLHAVTDAILGSLALGDIGSHFPNSDQRWRGAESSVFLRHAVQLVGEAGYKIVNVDTVIDLESPKLGPHISAIRENVAAIIGVEPGSVSVKAKTGEGVDAVGRREAIRAQAVVLVESYANTFG